MRRIGVLVILIVGLLVGQVSAQTAVPNGAFVKDAAGDVWLVLGGERLRVPLYPSDEATITAIPDSGKWVVPTSEGGVAAGERPDWVSTTQSVVQPATQPAPAAGERTATFDGVTMTVLKVERGWKSDNKFIKPKDGNEYLTIEIRLDNAGSQPVDYNAYNFKAVTADGGRWNFAISRKPEISSGQILPGSPVRGWLTFEIPVGNPVTQLLWAPRYDKTLAISL
ncbi:MAG: DUF4352 domain-containing protein [Chloroflexi bacterium]|nr:DUF4352 domain-containing protein [Chloroflexota bacterium]